MDTKRCRDCGEEYRLDAPVSECTDCGGPVEAQSTPAVDETTAAPPVALSRLYTGASAREIEPLAARLAELAIPFTVSGGVNVFRLFVAAESLERAERELAPLLGGPAADHPAFDPEHGYSACPGCQSPLTAGTTECPECGLAIVPPDDACCSRCGTAVASDGACRSCSTTSD